MAAGNSGTIQISVSSTNGITGKIDWTETYDVKTNTSNVSAVLAFSKGNTGSTTVVGGASSSFSLIVNGVKKTVSWSYTFPAGGTGGWLGAFGLDVKNISHDSDGKKSITISCSGGDTETTGLKSIKGSSTVALTSIPRAATITSADNITLGNACRIVWTPKLASHRFKLKFSIGSWSYTTGVIYPGSTSAYAYTGYTFDVNTIAQYIVNSDKGTITATLYTYSDSGGTTQIGSASTKTFTATVPTDKVPTVLTKSITIDNSESQQLSSVTEAIQGVTKIRVRATASGILDSTISKYIIGGKYNVTVNAEDDESLDYTGDILQDTGANTFTVIAVDSRGRQSIVYTAGTVMVYQYNAPVIETANVSRWADDASYMQFSSTFSISEVGDNEIASDYPKIYYKEHEAETWTDTGDTPVSGTSLVLTPTFAQNKSYDFKLVILDTFGSQSVKDDIKIGTISVVMDFNDQKNGVAFGKMSENQNSVESNYDLMLYKNLNILWPPNSGSSEFKSFVDIVYPTGSIYQSLDPTSPAQLFGGLWERIEDMFLLAAGDTYAAGSIGGEAEHTLIVSELPPHVHSFKNGGHTWSWGRSDATVYASTTVAAGAGAASSNNYLTSHQNTDAETSTRGDGQAHNNMPPYLTVYTWKRMMSLTITQQPEDISAPSGTTISFTVAVDGGVLPYTYDWQYQRPGQSNWTSKASGNGLPTTSLEISTNMNGRRYRCVVTDAAGTVVTSRGALITTT